jgi:hypothetical protein
MIMPGFTAEASLYRTRQHYSASSIDSEGLSSSELIVPAYYPDPGTRAACDQCFDHCGKEYLIEYSIGVAALAICGWWNPICLGIASGELVATLARYYQCSAACALPLVGDCCPTVCGFPNPFVPGEGCCGPREQCVDRSDPNARDGCCPAGQSVCGGKCCPTGGPCCGDECGCTGGTVCTEGACTFPSFGSGGPPPQPPLTQHDIFCFIVGGTPCYNKCCPPDKTCCCPPGRQCGCYHDYLCIQ